MKKIIPTIISFLAWLVLLIVDTIVELQDTMLAESLQSVFSGIGFTRTTLMGIQFSQLDSSSYGVTFHFFVVLIIFILIGLFIGYKKEVINYVKNLGK
ncbi:hypothetical protein RD055328_03220 [Companilactobacillus sp. RD055328]|uniref:hypothetical protein n=1 Tax=Companilactobacillus sp. RD055328 TaxID=2916634 RepID=UPI001FC87BDD|nr:hypothetical protein [Companilactobacillus sp. RD055328]GKQ42399.1 hypothetical protein RD055328_03220 [Companilactobacillus sp. RD055328]